MSYNFLDNVFEHVVLIDPKYRLDNEVPIWLFDNISPHYYEILYAQRLIPRPMDGLNESHSVLWGAAFKNEEDAMAFKLRWT